MLFSFPVSLSFVSGIPQFLYLSSLSLITLSSLFLAIEIRKTFLLDDGKVVGCRAHGHFLVFWILEVLPQILLTERRIHATNDKEWRFKQRK